MTGIGTDLVEDAADEQGTVVAFTFARVELMDGIRTALDVPFQGKPGLFLFFFLGPVFFLRAFHRFQNLAAPVPKFFVSVLISPVGLLLPVYIESGPSGNHGVGTPGEGGKLCGKLLFIGGDVSFVFFFGHFLQVIVKFLFVNHDVRFSPDVRIERVPSVGIAGLLPQVFQIAGVLELRHFPILELCRSQLFPFFGGT